MLDKFGKVFSDSFAVSFHMSYYRILKWLLALPVIAVHVAVFFYLKTLGHLQNLPLVL